MSDGEGIPTEAEWLTGDYPSAWAAEKCEGVRECWWFEQEGLDCADRGLPGWKWCDPCLAAVPEEPTDE